MAPSQLLMQTYLSFLFTLRSSSATLFFCNDVSRKKGHLLSVQTEFFSVAPKTFPVSFFNVLILQSLMEMR